MNAFRTLATVVSLLAMLAHGHGATLKVPQQYSTIQDAVDAAAPGDEIAVAKGVYAVTMLNGKQGLVLRGSDGAWIEPQGTGAVGIYVGTSQGIVIEGIAVRNGTSDGMVVQNSTGVLVRKCRVEDERRVGLHRGREHGDGAGRQRVR